MQEWAGYLEKLKASADLEAASLTRELVML